MDCPDETIEGKKRPSMESALERGAEAEMGYLVKEEGPEEPREHLISNAKEGACLWGSSTDDMPQRAIPASTGCPLVSLLHLH